MGVNNVAGSDWPNRGKNASNSGWNATARQGQIAAIGFDQRRG